MNDDKISPVAPEQVVAAGSPTAGMTLGERIAHVGGRENAQGYIEFGSVMAVDAFIKHVLRDLPIAASPEVAPAAPLLMQDENSGRDGRRYNEWHASRPDARLNAREAAAATPAAPSAGDSGDLVARLLGRARYVRDKGGVKSAELMEAAASALAQPAPVQSDIDAALDFEPDEQHTVADMANIGYALMQALPAGYAYNDSPAEIVADLQNEIADLKAAPVQARAQQAVELAALVLEGRKWPGSWANGGVSECCDCGVNCEDAHKPNCSIRADWAREERMKVLATALAAPTQAGAGGAKGGA